MKTFVNTLADDVLQTVDAMAKWPGSQEPNHAVLHIDFLFRTDQRLFLC